MTLGGLAAGLVVALASGAAARFSALREDASLAAFYLVSLALGVTIVSLKGSNVDLLHVLFGSALALDDATLLLLAGVSTLTLFCLAIFHRALVADTLDPVFLRRASRFGEFVPFLFLGLVVLNLVAGFHALGTLMAVGLIMLPAAAAKLWTRDLSAALPLAGFLGAVASYVGLVLSFYSGAPAGPAIILAAGVALFRVAVPWPRRRADPQFAPAPAFRGVGGRYAEFTGAPLLPPVGEGVARRRDG